MKNTIKRSICGLTKKISDFCGKNKDSIKCLSLCLIVLLLASNTYADNSIKVLDSAGDKIISLITAKWVKALLTVALIIEFGVCAFGNSQGEGGMIKKVLPWIIGTAGILGATSIVKFFFDGINVESLSMVLNLPAYMG